MTLRLLITMPVSSCCPLLRNKITLVLTFTENAKGGSSFQWMKTMMSKGTVSDKIAALTVTIQDNPVSNLEPLRNLVGMVKVSKKKECIAVIGKRNRLRFPHCIYED